MHHHLALAQCALRARDVATARVELVRALDTIECIVDRAMNAKVTGMLARLDRAQ